MRGGDAYTHYHASVCPEYLLQVRDKHVTSKTPSTHCCFVVAAVIGVSAVHPGESQSCPEQVGLCGRGAMWLAVSKVKKWHRTAHLVLKRIVLLSRVSWRYGWADRFRVIALEYSTDLWQFSCQHQRSLSKSAVCSMQEPLCRQGSFCTTRTSQVQLLGTRAH